MKIDKDQHPLSFQVQEYLKEANLSKLAGQVTLGIITALIVRWALPRIDKFFLGKKT